MRRILIIGGGASGTLAALHLLETGSDIHVQLVEARADIGSGLAYSTIDDSHVLNVRTGNMSAFTEDPDHFKRWLSARQPAAAAGEFVPRRLFGMYLCELLAKHGRVGGRFEVIRGTCTALAVRNDVVLATLADETRLEAEQVILATGSEPSNSGQSDIGFIQPWSGGIERAIAPGEALFILGSGLTMVDFVVSRIRRGHHGAITVLSRRGLTPQIHKTVQVKNYGMADLPPRLSPAAVLKWFRTEARLAECAGSDWRAVIDGIRPYTQWIWRSMSLKLRSQFLRHARPWWDVHRHRMAPHVAEELQSAMRSGQLRIVAGTLLSARPTPRGMEIEFWTRGRRNIESLTVAHAVQCTGIGTNPFTSSNPLIRQLVASGLGRVDPLGLGLDVTADCAIADRHGIPSSNLFAVGPITRAALWEITAVPDIRNQCALLANRLSLRARQKGTARQQSRERSKSWEEVRSGVT